jgi:hypothetical protein
MSANETIGMIGLATVAIGVFGLLAIGGFLLWRDTRRKEGKWGINLAPVFCPRCGTPAAMVQLPRTLRQMMWGGSTCANCSCEFDKWGKEIPGA